MLKKLKSKFSKFMHNERVQEVTETMASILKLFIGFGWMFVFDLSSYDYWKESKNVLYYSSCMFCLIVLGAICHAIFLFVAFLTIIAVFLACYYGWFVVLPLFLMFIVICIGRWLYLKKHMT